MIHNIPYSKKSLAAIMFDESGWMKTLMKNKFGE